MRLKPPFLLLLAVVQPVRGSRHSSSVRQLVQKKKNHPVGWSVVPRVRDLGSHLLLEAVLRRQVSGVKTTQVVTVLTSKNLCSRQYTQSEVLTTGLTEVPSSETSVSGFRE